MRISGTYFNRLLVAILSFTAVPSILLLLILREPRLVFLIFSGMTVVFWGIDSLFVFYQERVPLLLSDGHLFFGEEAIKPSDIRSITRLSSANWKLRIHLLEFKLNDGRVIRVLDKPRGVLYEIKKDGSKTLNALFGAFPGLKAKLRSPKSF